MRGRGTYAPVRYRRASVGDGAAIARLTQGHYGGDLAAWEVRTAAALGRGEQVLVATDQDEVVAYAKAGRRLPTGPDDPAPAGWYLTGVVVAEPYRRQGLARRLTRLLLNGLLESGQPVWSFADARNEASLALHADLGMTEVLRAPRLLGEELDGGEGVLFRADPA